MGKFDDSKKWCHERIAIAIEDLKDFGRGHKVYINGDDQTPALIARAKHTIERLTRLISGYEKHDG